MYKKKNTSIMNMEEDFSTCRLLFLPIINLSTIKSGPRDGSCPYCGFGDYTDLPNFEEYGYYEVDGKKYPIMCNEDINNYYGDFVHNWTEIHRCPKCKNLFHFENGFV